MKLAAALLGAIVLAGTQAAAPPARPVPVAANTLASRPDAFYGQTVSVTAAVDRLVSSTAFVIAGRLKIENRSAPADVLVLVPTFNGKLDAGTYVTVVGEFLRFDAAEIARRAKDYKLDLGPDMLARYEGGPAILATTVVNAALFDFAKRPPPPLTPEEEAFDKVMKRIGPAFNSLRTAAGASDAAATAEQAKALKAAFTDAEAFFKARLTVDAAGWSRTARAHLDTLERAAGAGNWEQVKTSVADVNGMCSTCHAAYRERLEDGTFRVKSALPTR